MISEEFAGILACPETKQYLSPADAELLAGINQAIDRGALKNVQGSAVALPVEAALVRADRQRFFPVRNGIPVLIAGEAVLLQEIPVACGGEVSAAR